MLKETKNISFQSCWLKIITIAIILMMTNTIGYADEVIINEIMYDPGTITCEWVELYNKNDVGVNLKDWRFYDGATHTLTFYQGTWTIPAKGYALLVDNVVTFTATYGTNTGNIIQAPMSLSNSGDTLAMIGISGGFVGSVTYDSGSGGKNNKTLERKEPSGNDWGEGTGTGGTPGRKNSLALPEVSSATTTRVRVNPESGSCRFGGTYTIDIKIDDAVGLLGWQFSLYFNPAILQPLTVEEGNFLKGNGTQTFWNDPVVGTCSIKNVVCTKIGTNSLPVSGSGNLARIRFRVVGTSNTYSMIDLEYLTLVGLNDGTISAGTVDGSVSVSYGFDLNNDNTVDVRDLRKIGNIFGTQDGDKEYNPEYDINLDGKIDLEDLVAISKNLSESPDIKVPQSPSLYGLEDNNHGIIMLSAPSLIQGIGNEFELSLSVSDVINLYGIQFGVEFDPDTLSLIGIEKGEFLGKNTFWIESSKSTPGTKKLAQCKIGNIPGVNGDGVVAKLKFKARAEGNPEIKIKDILALDSDMNHISINSIDTSINIISSRAFPPDSIAYPNPSLNNQDITFSPSGQIEIYTLSGELIKRLEGTNIWELTNNNHEPVASGIYLYILKTDNKTLQGKIGVIR